MTSNRYVSAARCSVVVVGEVLRRQPPDGPQLVEAVHVAEEALAALRLLHEGRREARRSDLVERVPLDVLHAGGARQQARHVEVVDPEERRAQRQPEQVGGERPGRVDEGESRAVGRERVRPELLHRHVPLAARVADDGHARPQQAEEAAVRGARVHAAQLTQQTEDVDVNVVVGLQHVLRVRAVLRGPAQAQHRLVRQVAVRVDEVHLHEVAVQVALEQQRLLAVGGRGGAEQEDEARDGAGAGAPAPRRPDRRPPPVVVGRRVDVDEQKDVAATDVRRLQHVGEVRRAVAPAAVVGRRTPHAQLPANDESGEEGEQLESGDGSTAGHGGARQVDRAGLVLTACSPSLPSLSPLSFPSQPTARHAPDNSARNNAILS